MIGSGIVVVGIAVIIGPEIVRVVIPGTRDTEGMTRKGAAMIMPNMERSVRYKTVARKAPG